jgi:endonuclease/exonuclease/phosphatase family metal-dependent hydrolase
MKTRTLALLFSILLITSCSKNSETPQTPASPDIILDGLQTEACLEKGLDSEIEAMTWNLERFPRKGRPTVTEVSKMMTYMDMDLIAIQEIKSTRDFEDLVASLPEHKGVYGWNQYIRLGFIYDSRDLEMIGRPSEIFVDNPREFPRSPLVATFRHLKLNITFTAINIHLKCCDNVPRRTDAMKMLKEYLDTNYAGKNLVVLGDFNQHLKNNRDNTNMYFPFMDEITYDVTTLDVISNPDDWSYPSGKWKSHLDQIIVSNEFVTTNRQTKTLAIDVCDENYLTEISDHRPVFVRITK